MIVTFKACDGGTPSLCSNVTVNIEVLDSNDNAPELSTSEDDIVISENIVVGTVSSDWALH